MGPEVRRFFLYKTGSTRVHPIVFPRGNDQWTCFTLQPVAHQERDLMLAHLHDYASNSTVLDDSEPLGENTLFSTTGCLITCKAQVIRILFCTTGVSNHWAGHGCAQVIQ